MSDLVETVAEAIQGALSETYSRPPWNTLSETMKDEYRTRARAALAAVEASHTIVELPPAAMNSDGWHWKAGDDTVFQNVRGETTICAPHTSAGEAQLIHVKNPRALAAALLAASVAESVGVPVPEEKP